MVAQWKWYGHCGVSEDGEMIDLDELERLAHAASSGEWVAGVVSMPDVQAWSEWHCVGKSFDSVLMYAACGPAPDDQSSADAAFIAAANPQVILELIAAIRRMGK